MIFVTVCLFFFVFYSRFSYLLLHLFVFLVSRLRIYGTFSKLFLLLEISTFEMSLLFSSFGG